MQEEEKAINRAQFAFILFCALYYYSVYEKPRGPVAYLFTLECS